MKRVGAAVAVLLLLSAGLLGCFTSQGGPPALSLAEQSREIDVTTERVGGVGTALTDDIGRFRTMLDQLLESDEFRVMLGKPYPIHLFKHTAISCLNEPIDAEPEPGTPAFEAAQTAKIDCVVKPLPVLLKKVRQDLPNRYDQTLEALVLVDQLRALRAETSAQLRDIPRMVKQTRNFISARRAELRRIELDVERNKPEFTGSNYQTSKDRVREYRTKLDKLEAEVQRVERTQSAWSIALGNAIRDLYKGIAEI